MKKCKRLKKWLLCVISLIMAVSVTGCSSSSNEELTEESMVYNYKVLPCMSQIKGSVTHYDVLGDNIYLYTTDWNDESMTQYFYQCKTDGLQFAEIPYRLPYNEDEWLVCMEASPEGQLYLLFSYYEEDHHTYILRTLDMDGSIVEELDIGAIIQSEDMYIQDMKSDPDGNLYLATDYVIYILDEAGKLKGQIEEENLMVNMIKTDDGVILAGFDYESGYTMKEIDPQELTFCETYTTKLSYQSIMFLSDGVNHNFYYNEGNGLYAYNFETKESAEMIDWLSSNININLLVKADALSDGRFVMSYCTDGSGDKYELCVLEQVDPKDVKKREIITYSSLYQDEEMRAKAVLFNESQDRYQVVLKDYSQQGDPVMAMHKDLIGGCAGDIVDLSGLCSDKYIAKNLFADLYPYMKDDPDVSKEEFLENALQIMETDGKLYHVTPLFGMNVLAVSASKAGQGSLSTQDVVKLEADGPEGTKAFYGTLSRDDVLIQNIETNYDTYMDWQNGTCHFDSQEFISALEYAGSYPAADMMQWDENSVSLAQSIREGTTLFVPIYSMEVGDLLLYEEMYAKDLALIGFPSETYTGGALSMNRDFAICANSQKKEGAWEFLKTFLKREYYSTHPDIEMLAFSIRKDSMEDMMRRYTATEAYTDDFGNEIKPLNQEWGYDDVQVKIQPLNKSQEDLLRKAIADMDHKYMYDSDIIGVVLEEAQGYFEGDFSAEEVSKTIQERVTVYMDDFLTQ